MTGRRVPVVRRLEEGLYSSVNGNAQAFGFSITVTVCFGVASQVQSRPSSIDLMLFALAGVAAFSALNVFVAMHLRDAVDEIRSARATLVGTATDFIAVGAAVGAAIGLNAVVEGAAAWVLTPFVAGLLYVLVQSVELAVGQRETERRSSSQHDHPHSSI